MMKKFLNILGIGLGCLMILGVVVVNVGRPIWESSFAGQVAAANRDCPIPLASGAGQITSICLEDNCLTYYANYSKGYNLLLNALGEEKFKEALLLSMICLNGQGDHQGDILMDQLAEEQCGIKFVVSSSGVKQFECKASQQELQDMRHDCTQNPHEALHSLLLMIMATEKLELPVDLGGGCVMTDCGVEGENVYFTTQMDENLYLIETLYKNKEGIKRNIVSDLLENEGSNLLLTLCKISHSGIIHRTVGSKTGQKFDILISCDEIRQMVQTPSNVNIH